MMTKKDYIAIADIIRKDVIGPDYLDVYQIERFGPQMFLDSLCGYLKRDNPNFDKNKFLEACGIKG